MPNYSPKDILRIAKRVNNAKRAYLLVNPLQAKHIPVSPSESLRMMNSLGSMLAEKYPGTKLVIGFAPQHDCAPRKTESTAQPPGLLPV